MQTAEFLQLENTRCHQRKRHAVAPDFVSKSVIVRLTKSLPLWCVFVSFLRFRYPRTSTLS